MVNSVISCVRFAFYFGIFCIPDVKVFSVNAEEAIADESWNAESFGSIKLGGEHSIMLAQDGSVWTTGSNRYGQLGDGTSGLGKYKSTFDQILVHDVKTVSAGLYHSMILKNDGSVWVTGWNAWAVFGDGSKIDRKNFVRVIQFGTQAIAAGWMHSMVLKEDGSVWTTGYNDHGQLGDGTNQEKIGFVEVIRSGGKTISAGWRHSMVLKQDGSVWTSGDNLDGQLGSGTWSHSNKFIKVVASGVKAVAAGWRHSMILKQDGSVWSVGSNKDGALGNGWPTGWSSHTFKRVVSSSVQAIAAGRGHSMVMLIDGSVWAAGDNRYGQLGDGTNDVKYGFVQVVSSGATVVAAGNYYSMVMKQDGSVWATGRNNNGQLGDGSVIDRNTFTSVTPFEDVDAFGTAHSVVIAEKEENAVTSVELFSTTHPVVTAEREEEATSVDVFSTALPVVTAEREEEATSVDVLSTIQPVVTVEREQKAPTSAPTSPTVAVGKPTVSAECSSCGMTKGSKLNCCARGGSWYGDCGDPGDSNFGHTWAQGADACGTDMALDPRPFEMVPPAFSAICPQCGHLKKSGRRSCCARGGAWFKNCGDTGDREFDHTWAEGVEACEGYNAIMTTKAITVATSACPACGAFKKTGRLSCCAPRGAWDGDCGDPGDSSFRHTWFEGVKACEGEGPPIETRMPLDVAICPMCGIVKKSGKFSCCGRGGSWSGDCGDPGDPNVGHTWSEGMYACERISVTAKASVKCPKCGVIMRSGQLSCCARDGAWFGQCGDTVDSNFGHTWREGIQSCEPIVSSFSVKEEAPPNLSRNNTSAQHPNKTLRANLRQEGNAHPIIDMDTDSASCVNIYFSVLFTFMYMYMQIQS